MENNFILMKNKDIKALKEKLWLRNNKKCPLLGIEVPLEKMALDHIHKLKSENYSEQKGTVRNAIEFRANGIEGKISNAWKRYFGSDESKHPISLPDFLRNLADYLEEGALVEESTYYVHPNEVPKEPKLSKRNYNKLKKLYEKKEFCPTRKNQKKKPFPEFPKSSKITKALKELYEEFQVNPYN
jgi:hypothetical protein